MGKVLPEGQRAVGVGSVQPSVLLLGITMLRWSRWFLGHCLQAIKHHVRNRLQNCGLGFGNQSLVSWRQVRSVTYKCHGILLH